MAQRARPHAAHEKAWSAFACPRGKSLIEAKVRLYNRTPLAQTFLGWANVGVRVHGQYQAFFPPDVTFVADHAKQRHLFVPDRAQLLLRRGLSSGH